MVVKRSDIEINQGCQYPDFPLVIALYFPPFPEAALTLNQNLFAVKVIIYFV